MTFKIEKSFAGGTTTIRLIGRMQSVHLEELKVQMGESGSNCALDLEQVTLVDVEAVRFLNECESAGISVLRCSPYVREWMQRERSQTEAPPEK